MEPGELFKISGHNSASSCGPLLEWSGCSYTATSTPEVRKTMALLTGLGVLGTFLTLGAPGSCLDKYEVLPAPACIHQAWKSPERKWNNRRSKNAMVVIVMVG